MKNALIFLILIFHAIGYCSAGPVQLVRTFQADWHAEPEAFGKGISITVTLHETSKKPKDTILYFLSHDPSGSIVIDPSGYNYYSDVKIDVSGSMSSLSKSPYEVFYLRIRNVSKSEIVCELLGYDGEVLEIFRVRIT